MAKNRTNIRIYKPYHIVDGEEVRIEGYFIIESSLKRAHEKMREQYPLMKYTKLKIK